MGVKTRALRAAFPHTLPILAGFAFLGASYGIFMHSQGFSVWWTLLMSSTIFAGSMEFVTVSLLTTAFQPLYALLLALMVNARHLFYGISMLDKYKDAGKKKWYLIFGLCDETFSILVSTEPPEGVDNGWFQFFVTLLNQCYWVGGAVLGGLLGSLIAFPTKGIEFVMTALFVVIFIDQWRSQKRHLPAVVGVAASVCSLLVFKADSFIVPAMLLILVCLTLLRKPLLREVPQ